jgi:hypothetical protein
MAYAHQAEKMFEETFACSLRLKLNPRSTTSTRASRTWPIN